MVKAWKLRTKMSFTISIARGRTRRRSRRSQPGSGTEQPGTVEWEKNGASPFKLSPFRCKPRWYVKRRSWGDKGFAEEEKRRSSLSSSIEMILRTPPPKRPRTDIRAVEESSPVGSDRQLVIYEDPPAVQDQQSEHLLCTYQCRQMVLFALC